jgi:hypothetical protein
MKEAILKECFEISLLVPIVLICDEMGPEIKKMLL